MRGQDRYGCSNHIMTGTYSNGRGIRRSVIEERVRSGLKDLLMAPEAAAEAMRARACASHVPRSFPQRLRPTSFTSLTTVSTIHRKVIGVAYRPHNAPDTLMVRGLEQAEREDSRRSGQPDSTHGRWTVRAPRIGLCLALGESGRRAPLNDAIAHGTSA